MEMRILLVARMAVRHSAVGVARVDNSTAVVTVPVYSARSVLQGFISVHLLRKLRICCLCK
jgi:hypothetical protein